MAGPWDAVWAEAEASCPTTYDVFETIELQHPAFVDGSGLPIALRFVLDVEARILGIEAGALFTPGEMASFDPTAMECEKPELSDGAVPRARLAIDNVGKQIEPYLAAALGYSADLKVIFRSYRSDDTSTPIYGPVEFVLTDLTVDGGRVEGVATIADFGDAMVPSRVYRPDEYSGLVA